MMKKNINKWYIRHKGSISGPFSTAVVQNKILVGRLSPYDEASVEQQTWQSIIHISELSISSTNDEQQRGKRNQDERDGFDRRHNQQIPSTEILQQRKRERRANETDTDIEYRQLRTLLLQRYRQHKERLYGPLLILFSLMSIAMLLAVLYPTRIPMPLPNCITEAGPNINWNNCSKLKLDLHAINFNGSQLRNSKFIGSNLMNASFIKADIAYADLRFTDLSYSQLQNSLLVGANLQMANLSYADLSGADLSFADLRDAKLGGSKLDNVIFDSAIWPNGKTCAVGSVGQCIFSDIPN